MMRDAVDSDHSMSLHSGNVAAVFNFWHYASMKRHTNRSSMHCLQVLSHLRSKCDWILQQQCGKQNWQRQFSKLLSNTISHSNAERHELLCSPLFIWLTILLCFLLFDLISNSFIIIVFLQSLWIVLMNKLRTVALKPSLYIESFNCYKFQTGSSNQGCFFIQYLSLCAPCAFLKSLSRDSLPSLLSEESDIVLHDIEISGDDWQYLCDDITEIVSCVSVKVHLKGRCIWKPEMKAWSMLWTVSLNSPCVCVLSQSYVKVECMILTWFELMPLIP